MVDKMLENSMNHTNEDLVTVIIPVYNGARFIDQSIQSILKQTYFNIELIVIDDGSTDNTDRVVRKYLDIELGDIKFDYIRQINRGKVAAVNNALQHSKGEYITILDHDDTYPNNSVARRVSILRSNPSAIAVYGDASLMNEKCIVYGKKRSCQVKCIEDLVGFFRNPIASCSIMFRRKVLDTTGYFDTNIRRLDDVDRNITLFKAGPLIYTPEIFWHFRTYRRNIFLLLRVRTVIDFYIIMRKYLGRFSRSYLFSKQLIFQIIKFLWECITWRK